MQDFYDRVTKTLGNRGNCNVCAESRGCTKLARAAPQEQIRLWVSNFCELSDLNLIHKCDSIPNFNPSVRRN